MPHDSPQSATGLRTPAHRYLRALELVEHERPVEIHDDKVVRHLYRYLLSLRGQSDGNSTLLLSHREPGLFRLHFIGLKISDLQHDASEECGECCG